MPQFISALDRALERTTIGIAVLGGILCLGVALLVVVSVLGRWLIGQPVQGDFEFVKTATAIAVFSFLPYTQIQRGNIMVDTFTRWLPKSIQLLLDAIWDVTYVIAMALSAWCLLQGACDALRSGETTMMAQMLIWPAIAISAALCAFLALIAASTAAKLIAARQGRS